MTLPKICYTPKDFKPGSLTIIAQSNQIIKEYEAQGLQLTLRQLPSSTTSSSPETSSPTR